MHKERNERELASIRIKKDIETILRTAGDKPSENECGALAARVTDAIEEEVAQFRAGGPTLKR